MQKISKFLFLFFGILCFTFASIDNIAPVPDCFSIKDCSVCAGTDGCNYCSKGMDMPSYCTNATNAEDAKCSKSECATDKFITSPPKCFGGCESITECSACSAIKGCGWCFKGKQGCVESDVKPASCSLWVVGSCVVPCEGRLSCLRCLGDSQCSWSSTENVCRSPSLQQPEDWLSNSQCPKVPETTIIRHNNGAIIALFSPLLFFIILSVL